MDSNIFMEALKLLVVGMVTVFTILLIVIYFGKALIAIVNKVAPEEVKKSAAAPQPATQVDPTTMSVIQAAVSQLTGGKGTVSKVEPMK